MQYLIIILDESADSFCFYPNPGRKPKLMELETLKKAVYYAQVNGLKVNLLYGKDRLPQAYLDEIDRICHINIIPSSAESDIAEDIIICDSTGGKCPSIEDGRSPANVILRIDRAGISRMAEMAESLSGKYRRLNIIIQGIEDFTQEDFERYEAALDKLYESIDRELARSATIECNILTDRMVLEKMNNCDAGVRHITLAPNGKFYICPAFYYEDEKSDIGDLQEGTDIKNPHLYRLPYAPLCRSCDAFQCKRCVWLNRKTTREVNTPSHEQCVVSHLERNASRKILENAKRINKCHNPNISIPEIDYLDPFENIKKL